MPYRRLLKGTVVATALLIVAMSGATERYRAMVLPGDGQGKVLRFFIPEIGDEATVAFGGYVGERGSESAAIGTLRTDGNVQWNLQDFPYPRTATVGGVGQDGRILWAIAGESPNRAFHSFVWNTAKDLSGGTVFDLPDVGFGSTVMCAGALEQSGTRTPMFFGGLYLQFGRKQACAWVVDSSGNAVLLFNFNAFRQSEIIGCEDVGDGVILASGRVQHWDNSWQSVVWQCDRFGIQPKTFGQILPPGTGGGRFISLETNPVNRPIGAYYSTPAFDVGRFRFADGTFNVWATSLQYESGRNSMVHGLFTVLRRDETVESSTPPILIADWGAVLDAARGGGSGSGIYGVGASNIEWPTNIRGLVSTFWPDVTRMGAPSKTIVDVTGDESPEPVCVSPSGVMGGSVSGRPAVFVPTNRNSPDSMNVSTGRATPGQPYYNAWAEDGETIDVELVPLSERRFGRQRAVTDWNYVSRLRSRYTAFTRIDVRVVGFVEGAAVPLTCGVQLWNVERRGWDPVKKEMVRGEFDFIVTSRPGRYVSPEGNVRMRLVWEHRGHVTVLKVRHDVVMCSIRNARA